MYDPSLLSAETIELRPRARSLPSKRAKLCFVGDLMLGRRVSQAVGRLQPHEFWHDTLPLLGGADAVIANLESPITLYDGRWSKGWKAFRFAASPAAIDVLRSGNVRAVNLANNHMLDCEEQGLEDTLRHLDRAEIFHAGAGMDLTSAWQPALFRAGPLKVGLIGLTDNMKEFAASQDQPGTARVAISTEPATLTLIARLASELRRAGAGVIVLSVHWGPNLRPWPTFRFRAFAHAVIRAGVNIVHGHSAHLLQGVEAFEGGVILYDTGDFLDDYWVFPGIRTDHGCAFVVELDDGRPVRLELVPVLLRPCRVSLAKGGDFDAIVRTMTKRSACLGTPLRTAGNSLTLEVAAGSTPPWRERSSSGRATVLSAR